MSQHPAVDGRSSELGALADEVRRLIGLTLESEAPPEVLATSAAKLREVAGELERHRAEDPVTHSMAGGGHDGSGLEGLEAHMPFDPVIGRFNPLALPLKLSSEGSRAIALGSFTLPYEGPPGCVHGSVIAASFDIVLTAANILADAAGPTVSLTIRYLRPTLLEQRVAFEAEVSRQEGNRTFSSGRLVQNRIVTAEAQGEFVALDRRVTRDLRARQRPTGNGDA